MSRLSRILNAIPRPEGRDLFQLQDWHRRLATLIGALLVGLLALFFTYAGDSAQRMFEHLVARYRYLPLVLTPALFVVIVIATRKLAPETRGSGIPQVIAAASEPEAKGTAALVSLKAGLAKIALTVAAMLGGASVGREGPTVQLGAAIMVQVHRLFGVRLTSGVYIAGGAAGVAAAFNTPLAGIAFAIEELAVAYEQRIAVLVMGAVMIAGLTAQGLVGNYIYFGHVAGSLPITTILIVAPVAGILGGILGGLFARLMLALRGPDGRWRGLLERRPVIVAFICGVVVAVLGIASDGASWGTGYEPTRALLEGGASDPFFAPAKFVASLATAVSGMPGGIFAPSLAVGAGFGSLLTWPFDPDQAGAIVLLGMAGYFVGVVRAPLTAVIILSEATGSTGAILPLFATALIGDWAGAMVCRKRLYHVLAQDFMPKRAEKRDGTKAEG